jgi:hypothetical protein
VTLCFLVSLAPTNAHGQTKVSNKIKVVSLQFDTLKQSGSTVVRNIIALGPKKFSISNNFVSSKNGELSIRNYKGLSVAYNGKILKNTVDLYGKNVRKCLDFFAVFKGDSVDNELGFNALYRINSYAGKQTEYFLLNGYYYGCNGSFCNNGALLVVKIVDNTLNNLYLVGIDRSIVDVSSTTINIEKGNLIVKLYKYDRNDLATSLVLSNKIELKKNVGYVYCIK